VGSFYFLRAQKVTKNAFLLHMLLFAGSKSNQKEPCDKKNSLIPYSFPWLPGLLSRFFLFHFLFLID
jgi:hypothetical protein